MRRSNFIILLLCLLFTSSVVHGQADFWKSRRYEAAAGIGPTFFFGDVGGFSRSINILGIRDITFRQARYDLNLNVKYRITSDINVRLSVAYGFLHAADTRGSNEGRGFAASMSIFEPALIGEYYFIKNKSESSYLFSKGRSTNSEGLFSSFDFYAFTGIGGLSYSVSPNDKLNQKLANGGIKPAGFTAIIPVGVGTSFIYSPDFNFGIELGGRYSFTDNLDGYTSQYSSSNDVYYFLNFTITYKLKTGANGLPSFR